MVEVDREAVDYLQMNIPDIGKKILYGDFLKMDMQKHFSGNFSVIGNFPYNISSQIFFRILEMRNRIPEGRRYATKRSGRTPRSSSRK